MTALGEYLKDAARRRWDWGAHDCSTWPARWAGVAVDPFASEQEALDRIEAAGGLVALWRSTIGTQLQEANEPQDGDIGVIRLNAVRGHPEIGAIHTGGRWAFLTPLGLAVVHADPLACWRVECLR